VGKIESYVMGSLTNLLVDCPCKVIRPVDVQAPFNVELNHLAVESFGDPHRTQFVPTACVLVWPETVLS
jgi:hypothetical protein